MSKPRETWDKPRARHEHFTEAEIEKIHTGFNEGKSSKDVAQDLQCSIRVINAHYAMLRACNQTAILGEPLKRADYTARLYKGNFEL